MAMRRSLSADNLADLSSNRDWIGSVAAREPRLVMYNDGTGCVLELRRPGDGENQKEWEGRRLHEFPQPVARAVHRFADFVSDLNEPCSRHFWPTVLGSLLFGGVWLASQYLISFEWLASGSAGTPIVWGRPLLMNMVDGTS